MQTLPLLRYSHPNHTLLSTRLRELLQELPKNMLSADSKDVRKAIRARDRRINLRDALSSLAATIEETTIDETSSLSIPTQQSRRRGTNPIGTTVQVLEAADEHIRMLYARLLLEPGVSNSPRDNSLPSSPHLIQQQQQQQQHHSSHHHHPNPHAYTTRPNGIDSPNANVDVNESSETSILASALRENVVVNNTVYTSENSAIICNEEWNTQRRKWLLEKMLCEQA